MIPPKRVREIGIEVAIGCLIVLGAVATALYSAWVRPLDHEEMRRWVGLAVNTAFAFGYPLKEFRDLWPRAGFWLLLFTLLAAHMTLFVLLLTRVRSWPLLAFVPIALVELQVVRMMAARYRLGGLMK